MWWLLLMSVACLSVMTDACCPPDHVTANYDVYITAKVPSPPTEPPADVTVELTGEYTVDFPNGNYYDEASGNLDQMLMRNGELKSETIPVKAQVGIISGEKIWVQGEAGKMGKQCYYVEIDGGIPDSYQCILNYYTKGEDNNYTAPYPSHMYKESVVVDDDCQPRRQNIDINIPNSIQLSMKARLKDYQQSVKDSLLAKNNLPAGCHKYKTIKLPSLKKGGMAGLQSMMGAMMSGGPPPQKRSFPTEHRQVMAELTKRSFQEIFRRTEEEQRERREAKKSMEELKRKMRSVFKEMF